MTAVLLLAAAAVHNTAHADEAPFFDGKTLSGWTGEDGLWAVERTGGERGEEVPAVVGRSPGLDHNSFLTTNREYGDFDLSFEVKLTPDDANSGVQFRSVRIAGDGEEAGPGGEMRGYQADIGATWWGKLYEENARGMLYGNEPGQNEKAAAAVTAGGWNTYRIRCEGDRVRTWLNGVPAVDLTDPDGRKTGVIGLQLHSGGPLVVRFRRFQMKEL